MVLILNCLLERKSARVFEKEIARSRIKLSWNTGLYGWRK